uniref:Uncharacterized protein n=1 Tax=Rhipicephalus zambeziensis TaxID=60191 RepID=A0A224Z0S4_9ACAR
MPAVCGRVVCCPQDVHSGHHPRRDDEVHRPQVHRCIGSECVSHTSRYASSEEEMHDRSSRPRSSEEEELGGLVGRKIKANETKKKKKKWCAPARPLHFLHELLLFFGRL